MNTPPMTHPDLPSSQVWRAALAARPDDPDALARDALRASLSQVRRAAGELASRIASDLPDFTVHDGSHLDALWPLVDLIGGPEIALTPTEAWVLGVAIVLHDLGLAVAAYPGGRKELRATKGWPDARAAALRARLGRSPTPSELEAPDPELDQAADAAVLRQRHAQRAAELMTVTWDGDYLVTDPVLRDALGSTAARIAASHWWPAARVSELGAVEGAPAGMPSNWTVRPILLGVLLRVADAAHLDAARAPRFARSLRKLTKLGARHWDFQARLRQPVLNGDQLRYVSSRSFPIELADAWWLCRDHLSLLNDELIAADATLLAHQLRRLAARSVEGIRDARALAQLIRPEGWEPIDAQVEVSDVARLVRFLGGRALYGDARAVPLRELIQNGSDAVRARQALRPGFKGRIDVRIAADLSEIIVADTGVGMSGDVLSGALLDFGRSLWESDEVAALLPGLQAAGFQPSGRFGIGFFSVFMWADDVTVISRSLHASESDTWALEFTGGLGMSRRPLLRRANEHERLAEPGTAVSLRVRAGENELATLLETAQDELYERRSVPTEERLTRVLRWIAPTLEVDLFGAMGDSDLQQAVIAGDWLDIPTPEILSRTSIDSRRQNFSNTDVDAVIPIGTSKFARRSSRTDRPTGCRERRRPRCPCVWRIARRWDTRIPRLHDGRQSRRFEATRRRDC